MFNIIGETVLDIAKQIKLRLEFYKSKVALTNYSMVSIIEDEIEGEPARPIEEDEFVMKPKKKVNFIMEEEDDLPDEFVMKPKKKPKNLKRKS